MIDVGGLIPRVGEYHSWEDIPELHQNIGRANHKKQASKQHFFMASTSAPALNSYSEFP